MKNKTRLWAALLSCALFLTGCGPRTTEPEPYPEPAGSEIAKTVAYVPLDDRPDNVERVVYLAESLGYALRMPDRDLYRTALDGQPLNSNGTQYGDMGRLYAWVLEQEAAGCDRYILSLDQLLSGGLVNSRCATAETVAMPEGREAPAAQALEELLAVLAEDPDNVVWLLDSVMRLAPTVGYAGGTLEEYNWIRDFGAGARETLAEDALTLENVFESYWRTVGWDWEKFYDDVVKKLGEAGVDISGENYYRPFGVLAANLDARERKLRLSDQAQRIIARPGHENFRLMIGIDDSSLEDCIQKNEIAYLRQGLRTDRAGNPLDWLLAGVDDLAFKAVARMYLDETGWRGGTAAVQYYGGTENAPACDYDFQPLTTVVAEHMDLFGLTESGNPLAAGLQVLVLTQPAEEESSSAYYEALLRDLRECRERNQPVILIDAGNGRYGTAFHEKLTKEAELGWLLSYAGFLDMAIVTGTALSHGVARYAYLQSGEESETAERAFARTLADSVLKDFCYKNVVRNDLLAYIRNDLGGDPNNFWVPEIDRESLQERLERGMESAVGDVVKNLRRSNFFALEPGGERGWGGVALENYRFPWDRAFEIGMDIRLGAFTEPHEKILGFYYQ